MKFLSIRSAVTIAMLFFVDVNLLAEETAKPAKKQYTESDLSCNEMMMLCKDKEGNIISSFVQFTDRKTGKLYIKAYGNGTLKEDLKYYDKADQMVDYNSDNAFIMMSNLFHPNGTTNMNLKSSKAGEGTITIYSESGIKTFDVKISATQPDKITTVATCYLKNGKTRKATDNETDSLLQSHGVYPISSPCKE